MPTLDKETQSDSYNWIRLVNIISLHTHSHIITLLLHQSQRQEHWYPMVHDYQWTGQTKLIKVPSEVTPCCHLVQRGRKASWEDAVSCELHDSASSHQICIHVIMHTNIAHDSLKFRILKALCQFLCWCVHWRTMAISNFHFKWLQFENRLFIHSLESSDNLRIMAIIKSDRN